MVWLKNVDIRKNRRKRGRPAMSWLEGVKKTTRRSLDELRVMRYNEVFVQLFTVVKNVKQAHQCHESGETQEFNDDIEYLLESIQPANPTGARALGVLSFASKCMGPAFRIHLRAHGIIPKIFSALQDAPINADRLTMDLEASTLNLMLKLLESGSAPRDKYTERVFQLCEQLQAKGLAKHINLDDLSTASLAMETLLGMASKRAGDWFKEELRNLGGLDHIVETVGTCVRDVMPQCLPVLMPAPTEKLLKLDRCLRILESVSYKCPENQTYLTSYKQSMLIFSCVRLLKLCQQNLSSIPPLEAQLQTKDSPAWVQLTCLLSLLKLFVILTHENVHVVQAMIIMVGRSRRLLLLHTPPERRFDILVLSLGLLINLMENCEANRERLVMAKVGDLSAMQCLVELCLVRLQSAQKSEEHTDAILDGQDQQPSSTAASSLAATTQTSDLEELLTKGLCQPATGPHARWQLQTYDRDPEEILGVCQLY
ncbi:WAPAL, partial [Cordylochernes scorpioides]